MRDGGMVEGCEWRAREGDSRKSNSRPMDGNRVDGTESRMRP